MKKQNFHVIFHPEPEGGYTVTVPALPGCVTYGKTIEEAENMVQEAIELYLEVSAEEKAEIIDDSNTFIKTLAYA